ncbi:MAG: RnfABCDGE type electron transport complex subunit G [Bacteroidales bacterium]|nr:RnfABCDGE type electron transport complex subunit G [Bacteroidales bacterium]MBN2699531.1 RnfABCDGE type electron transport complex subunit G [Bacteroidales bacterium]
MAKKKSTFLNMVLTLLVITLVASALLGSIYSVTSEPIRMAELAQKNEAIQTVVPPFDNVPSEEVSKLALDGDTLYFYTARIGDSIIGTAVETFTNEGFSGEIKLMVGFRPDGTIIDIAVLSHAETPGLGDKMEKSKSAFSVQFQDKNPESFRLAVKKDRGDVDAITASTISSRAYCDAVQRAYDGYMKVKKEK